MAFGITRTQLKKWKKEAEAGEIAFLTHYWLDERFPHCTTVTKVACCNVEKLIAWGQKYGLRQEWIHYRADFPHFDLLGDKQKYILEREGLLIHLQKFSMSKRGGN